jgi:hypothetical protein
MGRRRPVNIGVRNPRAKLDEASVQEIRRRLDRGQCRKELANQYGVSKPLIDAIACRRVWMHVPWPSSS